MGYELCHVRCRSQHPRHSKPTARNQDSWIGFPGRVWIVPRFLLVFLFQSQEMLNTCPPELLPCTPFSFNLPEPGLAARICLKRKAPFVCFSSRIKAFPSPLSRRVIYIMSQHWSLPTKGRLGRHSRGAESHGCAVRSQSPCSMAPVSDMKPKFRLFLKLSGGKKKKKADNQVSSCG